VPSPNRSTGGNTSPTHGSPSKSLNVLSPLLGLSKQCIGFSGMQAAEERCDPESVRRSIRGARAEAFARAPIVAGIVEDSPDPENRVQPGVIAYRLGADDERRLAHAWMELDSRWQSQPRVHHSLGLDTRDPFIWHFSGRLKAWVYRASSDADISFYDVLNRTAWREWRPPSGFQAMAYRAYDSPLRRILYPIERRILSWQNRIQDRRRVPPA